MNPFGETFEDRGPPNKTNIQSAVTLLGEHSPQAGDGSEDTKTPIGRRETNRWWGEKPGEVALVKKCDYPSKSQLELLEAEAEEAGGSVLPF